MPRRYNPRNKRRRSIDLSTLDYKQPDALKPFLNDFGRILPRHKTRLSAAAQRKLAREVKRARHIALLPFVED